jgi:hypothetical protein
MSLLSAAWYLYVEKINPGPHLRVQEQNLSPDKQRCSEVGGVESFIAIQVSQNIRIDNPEKLNLRDSPIFNQRRVRALPKDLTSDQPVANELEPGGSHRQLMED